MIKVENIRKEFGDNLVLNDVSFSFEKRKTNLIIGESGSGKTTLLKLLIGLHTLDSGNIIYDGRVFNEMKLKQKRLIRQEI
jgi:phospholipid/cholesterol/gamma-HCH transport system ATP-binding protein